MPVLETQALSRSTDRKPLFFAGHPRTLGEHPGVGHYVQAFDRPHGPLIVQPISQDNYRIGAETSVRQGATQALLIRSFDIVVAGLAAVLLLPVMLLIALAVKLTSSGPAIFRQQRVGRDGVFFPCLKFRSMVVDAQVQLDRLLSESEDARTEWDRDQKLRQDPRVTPIGDFLRRTSLDELPQLFNILVGQMSIVGPRPIVEGEITRYGSRFGDYCSVRPGLTGLWQISGRNDVSYGMRVRLDSLYAHRQSLALNFAICLKTVPAILTSRGCY
jgi:lipopolysaccharide/colanic/teichoic acid biosynthesis glycosyltransferase